MFEIMNKLIELGYYLTHSYEDGVIRLEKDGTGGRVFVFVRANGTVTPAKDWATAVATMNLREAFGNRVVA